MSKRLCDRIRIALETTPGLTQRGLAECMGLNPAAVNRMLYGQRNIKAEEIPVIEAYLGVKLDLHRATGPMPSRRGFSDAEQQPFFSATDIIPVYGGADESRAVDWTQRHPAQLGIKDAFAVYISSDDMAPRYFKGELAYIHPYRPLESNKDCMIRLKSGKSLIVRLINEGNNKVKVMQFHPPQEKNIARSDIKHIYAVVGRG